MNGRPGELGQPAGDLGFAHAGGTDHHDVLRRDLGAHLLGQLLPPPAIADRDRHGPLGGGLADDVAIELGDDLARRQVSHASSSTTNVRVRVDVDPGGDLQRRRTISAADRFGVGDQRPRRRHRVVSA